MTSVTYLIFGLWFIPFFTHVTSTHPRFILEGENDPGWHEFKVENGMKVIENLYMEAGVFDYSGATYTYPLECIQIYNASNIIIRNCVFTYREVSDALGVYLYNVSNCIIENNLFHRGLQLKGCQNVTLAYNTFSGGFYPLRLTTKEFPAPPGTDLPGSGGHWGDGEIQIWRYWSDWKPGDGKNNSVVALIHHNIFRNTSMAIIFHGNGVYVYQNNIIHSEFYATPNLTLSSPDNKTGNYWDSWTAPDADGDGIVDQPKTIEYGYGYIDYHPSVKPFDIPEKTLKTSTSESTSAQFFIYTGISLLVVATAVTIYLYAPAIQGKIKH